MRVVKVLRIACELARIGVIRKSQFRVEFLSQVFMDCVWYATKILVFEVLFLYTDTLAGWTVDDVRVLLGFVFVSDAFMMMWLGQRWRFARDLKDGKLDPFRVRPASPLFLYLFQQFSAEAVVNMVIALGYLGLGLARSGRLGSPATLAVLPVAIVLSWWAMTVTTVLFSLIEFHVLNSDIGMLLSFAFDSAAANPLDIFARRVRLFLIYVVPVGVFAYVPASMALGRVGLLAGFVHVAWMLGLGLVAFRAWNLSFRRYESAMG